MNDLEEEPDFDQEEEEIMGYECYACGNIQENKNGFGCNCCMSHELYPIK